MRVVVSYESWAEGTTQSMHLFAAHPNRSAQLVENPHQRELGNEEAQADVAVHGALDFLIFGLSVHHAAEEATHHDGMCQVARPPALRTDPARFPRGPTGVFRPLSRIEQFLGLKQP